MVGQLTKTASIIAFSALFALVACSGASDEASSTTGATIETNAPIASEAPSTATAATTTTTTTEAVNGLERDPKVNAFLDAAESNANCTDFECITAQATYNRYLNLYELAGEIPDNAVLPYFTAMSSAWDTWNDCLSTAESRFDRFECAEDSDMEQATTDLYNALRQ